MPAAGPTSAPPSAVPAAAAPGLARHLACMVYEGLLLFGVVMVAGYLYASLTQQRHALQGTAGLQAFMFLVIGIYFTWFWAQGRQTVAMKTWQLRVMTHDGRPLSQPRAFARYVASWLWCLPGLAVAGFSGRHDGTGVTLALLGNVAAYALIARLTPSRRMPHDLLCGTRLERWRPPAAGQNPAP